jgi:hypothetical protein
VARIFVSYAEVDGVSARRLADALRGAGHEPWVASEQILIGESIPAAIDRALGRADYVIVCLSVSALASGWVENELAAAVMKHFASKAARVLPVRLGDVSRPSLIAHLLSADLFPDGAAWERGLQALIRSIDELEGRKGGAPAPKASPVSDPYDPWAVATPPRFEGRTLLWRRLEEALENGRSVSLVGDFRIGKSSILRTWEARAHRSGRTVRWVSGEEASGQSPRSLVEAITGGAAPEDADGAASELDRWVRAVGPADLPPLLLVDEVDAMIRRFQPRFFERLRGMIGRKAVVLALSSCREIDRLYKDRGETSPFDNLLEMLPVGLLEPEAAGAIIGWGADQLEAGDAELMQVWAGRHPFYLKLLGWYLLRARRDGEAARAGLERFQDEAARYLRTLWGTMDERERGEVREQVMRGTAATRRSLRRRGIVTEEGRVFGEVLAAWVREEAE